MKRKLLLMAALVASVLGMSAQSWTAPTIAGEDPVAGTQYKVMNVGAVKFLDMGKAWFSWNTTAVLSDNGINFTMTADGSNWKFIRTGTQGVFTSGNGVPGDAMHVDNNAHTYSITKLPSGYYKIHDVNNTLTCWGYIEHNNVWGPVAHADATTIGSNGEWVFLTDLSAIPVYKARLNLYNEYLLAVAEGINTDAAATVYNNPDATVDELNAAYNALNVAMKVPAVKTFIDENGKTNVNLTSFFENADFEKGNLTGWTSNDGGNAANNGNFSRHEGSWFVEKWTWQSNVSNGSLIHDDVYLPAGVYCITADAQNIKQSENNAGGKGLFLYANNDKTEIGIAASYSVYTTLDADGPLTIKFVIDGCTGNWVCYDNIAVTYYAQASDLLVPAIEAAEALNGKIPTAAYAALQQIVATNNITSGTPTDYLNAANTIQGAVAASTELVAPYATWKSIKAAAEAFAQEGGHTKVASAISQAALYVESLTTVSDLNDANTLATALMTNYKTWDSVKTYANALANVGNDNATANQTLKDAISEQAAVISNASTADKDAISVITYNTLPDATSALRAAMNTYVNAAQPLEGEFFDLTGLIVNPHFIEGSVANPTGWTAIWHDHPTGGWGGANELRIATHNFEAYHKAFELSQTIESLPKGTYKVTLQGFARHDGADKDKTNLFCGVVNQPFMNITNEYSEKPLAAGKPALGDDNGELSYTLNGKTVYQPNGMSGSYYFFQETNPATSQPFYTNEVQTLIPNDGALTIGFKCETWSDWVIWDNFHLYYYGSAIAVTIDENESVTYTSDIENATVTLNRTIKKGLNSVVLPFSMDQDEVEAKFGAGSKVYGVDGYNAEISSINFVTLDGIKANTPCILDAKEAGTSYQIAGRTIEVDEPTSTVGGLSFIGSYEASIDIEKDANNYILYNGKLYLVDSDDVTLKGTRAYFHVEGANAAREIAVTFDGGEATGIAEIDGEKVATGVMYNLAGQVVGDDYKGIVIIDGKKVLK